MRAQKGGGDQWSPGGPNIEVFRCGPKAKGGVAARSVLA